ncbi:MAG: hypothetical protein ACHQD9_02035 [Chitinophagales bacterium]
MHYRVKYVFIFLVLNLFCFHLTHAQPDSSLSWLKGWNSSAFFCYGKIWKHTPKFEPAIEDPSVAFEFALSKQMHGQQSWEYAHHYPFLGFAFCYNDLGNDSVLGKAYSLLPFIEIPIAGGKNLITGAKGFSASFRMGTGFALLTKYYDPVENPTNNVIASMGNNITQFVFAAQYKASDELTFTLGGSFTHYSTGAVRVPNLGINIPAARIGIRYQPKPIPRNEYLTPALSAVPKKIIFNAQIGLGFQEEYPAHGPMYHVYLCEFSAGKMLARWNLLSLGAQVNYKEAAYAFIRQEESYSDHYFINSLAAAGFGRDDFLFGNIGISLSLGYYFYKPSPLQIGFYQKLSVYYAFPFTKNESLKRISLGVDLTAGDFTADFVSVETGFRF